MRRLGTHNLVFIPELYSRRTEMHDLPSRAENFQSKIKAWIIPSIICQTMYFRHSGLSRKFFCPNYLDNLFSLPFGLLCGFQWSFISLCSFRFTSVWLWRRMLGGKEKNTGHLTKSTGIINGLLFGLFV